MEKDTLIQVVSERLRLIRNEYHLSQEKMSEAIGLSKKTLVQIEKERTLASWTTVISVCAVFRKSEILQMSLGDDPLSLIDAVNFNHMILPKKLTGGGKVFWKTIEQKGKFKVQKNILTNHYRLIDGNQHRWLSSFDQAYVLKQCDVLLRRDKDEEKIEG